MKPTLLIMAAGMGSRFGGLKQMEPVGENGEIIIDYSAFDAARAGFGKVVFVIKRDFENDFREIVGRRIENVIDVDYAFQEAQNMPPGREKPWGTGHAVLSAKDVVNTPFCVITADDFYGADTFKVMADHLATDKTYAMPGFLLENTLSENGTVARGICRVEDGFLKSITEHTAISMDNDFPPGTVCSMCMWGFDTNMFDYLEEGFLEFLTHHGSEQKSEFYLPEMVDTLVQSGREKVKVLSTKSKWYGMTYREDLPKVRESIAKLARSGLYDGMRG